MTIKSTGSLGLEDTLGADRSISAEFGGNDDDNVKLSDYKRGGTYIDNFVVLNDIPTTNSNLKFSLYRGKTAVEAITLSGISNITANEFNGTLGGAANNGNIDSQRFFSFSNTTIGPEIAVHKGCRANIDWFSDRVRVRTGNFTYSENSNGTYKSNSYSVAYGTDHNRYWADAGSGTSVIEDVRYRMHISSFGYYYVINHSHQPGLDESAMRLHFKNNGHNPRFDTASSTETVSLTASSGSMSRSKTTDWYYPGVPSAYDGTVKHSMALDIHMNNSTKTNNFNYNSSAQVIFKLKQYNSFDFEVQIKSGGVWTGTKIRYSDPSNSFNFASGYYYLGTFSCIMPTVYVKEKTKGFIQASEVRKNDYLEGKKDLNGGDEPQWVKVIKEPVSHTREGYYDIEGIHITGDHPVWITKAREWVPAGELKPRYPGANGYIEGECNPIYIETNPGHYSVYNQAAVDVITNGADSRTGPVWMTISGNYARDVN